MSKIVPSWILKGNRAKKHLGDLKAAVRKWTDAHPYTVVTRTQGKSDRHYLRFTSAPSPDIDMIAADFVYNLRSGLDHLMAALVPAADRSRVYFPIYFDGVWDPLVPGENEERTKARGRWQSDTAKVRPEALTILKSLQPAKGALDDNDPAVNAFLMLNRYSTKDRHQRLAVFAGGLDDVVFHWKAPLGNAYSERIRLAPGDVCKDGTELGFMPAAVDVEITGTPVILVEMSSPKGHLKLTEAFDLAVNAYFDRAVYPLTPYIHVSRKR